MNNNHGLTDKISHKCARKLGKSVNKSLRTLRSSIFGCFKYNMHIYIKVNVSALELGAAGFISTS